MTLILTDGSPPTRPCSKCHGVEFWHSSPGSPFWRCSTCSPAVVVYATSGREPRNIEKFTLDDPDRAGV